MDSIVRSQKVVVRFDENFMSRLFLARLRNTFIPEPVEIRDASTMVNFWPRFAFEEDADGNVHSSIKVYVEIPVDTWESYVALFRSQESANDAAGTLTPDFQRASSGFFRNLLQLAVPDEQTQACAFALVETLSKPGM